MIKGWACMWLSTRRWCFRNRSSGKPYMLKWAHELHAENNWMILSKIGLTQNCNLAYSRSGLQGWRAGLEVRKKLSKKHDGHIFSALGAPLPWFWNPSQVTWSRWVEGSPLAPEMDNWLCSGLVKLLVRLPCHLGQHSTYKICLKILLNMI